MCRTPIQKHFQVPRHVRFPIEKLALTTKVPSERLVTVLQTPKHFRRDLRDSRKRQKVSRETCGTPANTKKFLERLAGLPQTPKSFPRDLRDSRKCQKVSRGTCGTPANAKKFLERLAGLPQTPKSFSRDLRDSRKHQSKKRACGGSCFPVHALCYASTLWMDGAGYLAIFSSHFNMPSMTNMEMRQMVRKTVQHCQMGILLYISGPIQRKRLPMAVAPSQRP